ncbi:MAG: hypothetical protein ABI083_16710 [Lapillicoccus sp.]
MTEATQATPDETDRPGQTGKTSGTGPTGETAGAGTVLILTEEPLKAIDADKIVGLHVGEEVAYRVLVPADTKHNVLVSVLDHLSLFEMRQALEALRPVDRTGAHADADEALATSLRVLQEAGAAATGFITGDDPLPELAAEVVSAAAREIIVVTEPHALEDTFHADWASRAREDLGVPVLHMYAGDWRLG